MSDRLSARLSDLTPACVRTFAFGALTLGLATAITAGPPKAELQFEKYTLPNGLEVILHEDHRLPIVAVNLWYHVGPANEEKGRTGFAHLFEHMMFQSSGHVGQDQYFQMLEAAGATLTNGSTDFDRTNYMATLPADQLELALWLEADRMGFLLDRLDGAALANQQDVVRNERRQGVENAPYGLADEALFHQLFPQGHPYYASVIGSHEDVQAAQLEDVKGFFREYYCPNNASLCIAGDIDPTQAKAMVSKYFGTIARGADVRPVRATTPPITAERRQIVTDQVELERLDLAWFTAPIFRPGDAEAHLTAQILAGGKASRLYQALVHEKQIAQNVWADQMPLELGSILQIQATARPGHTAAELEAAIDTELARLATDGPTAEELDRARTTIWSFKVRSLENLNGMSRHYVGVADLLNHYNHHKGDPGYLDDDLARFASVTPNAVRDLAKNSLTKSKRVVIHTTPGEKVLPPDPPAPAAPEATAQFATSAEPWRDTVPSRGAPRSAQLPAAQTFTLPNGLAVHVVPARHLPVVSANIVVRSGGALDPMDRHGLASFTAAMLDEGTAKHDALGLARELESLGANLGTGASSDGSFVFGSALTESAPELLSLMAEVLLTPTFPPDEIDRTRQSRTTSLTQQKDSPPQTAERVFAHCLYGPAHPYGHLPLGDEEALAAITRDDLVDFYGRAYTPDQTALVLAGDLSLDDAKKLATQAFGAWKGTGAPAPKPTGGQPIAQRVVIVDRPDAPQTALKVGQIAVPRSHPNYEQINLMNTVVGGLFSARLNMNLREDKGYTYGCYSNLADTRGAGAISAATSVRTDVTGPAIREILHEYQRMTAEPPTAEEVAAAKDFWSRALPGFFETSEAVSQTFGSLFLLDQPADYYAKLPAKISGVTPAQVHQAAKELLRPERMIIVAVGDRTKIETQLQGLELGAVSHRAADGTEAPTVN